MGVHVLLSYFIFTYIIEHSCYETQCPDQSQWHIRSTVICKSSNLYGCLFDEIHKAFTERCLQLPSLEKKGRKNVFSGGIDRVPCEELRYQPFIFSTNGYAKCVYAKSICSQEGQIVSDDGFSDIDRSCRCDYTNGYAFLHESAGKCKCYPVMEDCTCYKKSCPPDSVLSPDYQCIDINNWKGLIKCPSLDATNTKKEDKHHDMPKVFRENDDKGSRNVLPMYMITLIIILFVSCVAVLAYLNTNIRRKTSYAVRISEVHLESFISLIEEEEFDCTEEIDNMSIHSKDKLIPFAHLHLNHSHSNIKDLMRLSADIRQRLLPITVPAFDIYLRQSSRTLNSWRENSNGFVKTSSYRKVLDCAKKYKSILITGDDGNGITSIMRNVVLAFEEEGYEIYPINTPVNIKQLYNPIKKILFCVENVCGRYDCEYNDIQLWSSLEIYIKRMLEENNVKLIVSCRHRVLQDSQFQKLKLFHSCVCNLSDDNYKYLENDLIQIAELYNVKCIQFKEHIYQVYKKTECFPLLCYLYYNINKRYNHDVTVKEFSLTPYSLIKSQLDELVKTGDFNKYCALALCVMFNNHLEEAFFIGEIPDELELVFTDTCEACRVSSSTSRLDLLKALNSLVDFVLKKENGVFSTFHDRLFDCLIFFFGHKIIKCIINHAQINVIMQRFIFKEYMAKSDEYKILISEDVLPMYFERLLHDWSNREVVHVFSNKNFIDTTFQGTLIRYVNDHRGKSKKEHLANVIAIELKETPLTMSCSKGYNKIVSWLINNDADVNECRYDGASPIFLACKECGYCH